MRAERVFSFVSGVCTILLLSSCAQASSNATFDAEQIAKISPCGMECLVYTIPEVGCTILNTTCQCSNEHVNRLTSITADCMFANCTLPESLALAKIQASICEFPYESQNEKLKIMTIVCTIITYGTVVLRLATRFLLGQRLGSDDYCIIAAVSADAIFTAFGAQFEEIGFGNHIWNIDLNVIPRLFLWFYLCEIFYIITITLIKFSILCFYLRIFPKRSFRLTCMITMVFCASSAIAFILVTIFQCKPVTFVWNKNLNGKCLNYNAAAWANAAINILQDILVLLIPISEVRHLQLTRKKKIGMYGMFSVGGLVCIFSMIRLNSLKKFGLTSDPTWDNVNMTFWTTLETTSAVLCACMPSIRALSVRYFPVFLDTIHHSKGQTSNSTMHGTNQSGILLSHTTHTYRSAIKNERPESQESWIQMPRTAQAATKTSFTPNKSFCTTNDSDPMYPTTHIEDAGADSDVNIKGLDSNLSNSSLGDPTNCDPGWDKSLPPTPGYTIPMVLATAHVGERAAQALHSKFSPRRSNA